MECALFNHLMPLVTLGGSSSAVLFFSSLCFRRRGPPRVYHRVACFVGFLSYPADGGGYKEVGGQAAALPGSSGSCLPGQAMAGLFLPFWPYRHRFFSGNHFFPLFSPVCPLVLFRGAVCRPEPCLFGVHYPSDVLGGALIGITGFHMSSWVLPWLKGIIILRGVKID